MNIFLLVDYALLRRKKWKKKEKKEGKGGREGGRGKGDNKVAPGKLGFFFLGEMIWFLEVSFSYNSILNYGITALKIFELNWRDPKQLNEILRRSVTIPFQRESKPYQYGETYI